MQRAAYELYVRPLARLKYSPLGKVASGTMSLIPAHALLLVRAGIETTHFRQRTVENLRPRRPLRPPGHLALDHDAPSDGRRGQGRLAQAYEGCPPGRTWREHRESQPGQPSVRGAADGCVSLDSLLPDPLHFPSHPWIWVRGAASSQAAQADSLLVPPFHLILSTALYLLRPADVSRRAYQRKGAVLSSAGSVYR